MARVLADARVQALGQRCGRSLLADLVRAAVGQVRASLLAGDTVLSVGGDERNGALNVVVDGVRRRLADLLAPRLAPVINATGIILHTNLGRSPLAAAALDRIAAVAGRYSDLEVDLDSGERGHRHRLVEDLLCRLTGAEAATVVNNNAAAVMLTLNALAAGRAAVVSRGQLVEIGGAFRLPEMMQRSGARMVEVGTTNRTHLSDYETALDDDTGVILSVHPSNFRVQGFTAQVELVELVTLGHARGVRVVEDLGAGALVDLTRWGLPAEPLVSASVTAGADVVTCSGDKVMGGPQAGIIVGHGDALEAIRRHPWMRALRCGKLTYAALEATLRLYLDPERLPEHLPVLAAMTAATQVLQARAEALCGRLKDLTAAGWSLEVTPSVAHAGSGALPLEEIPSLALRLTAPRLAAHELAARLRRGRPAVLGYVRHDRLHLDLRTVAEAEVDGLAAALRRAGDK